MNERINIFGTFVFAIASVLLLLLLLCCVVCFFRLVIHLVFVICLNSSRFRQLCYDWKSNGLQVALSTCAQVLFYDFIFVVEFHFSTIMCICLVCSCSRFSCRMVIMILIAFLLLFSWHLSEMRAHGCVCVFEWIGFFSLVPGSRVAFTCENAFACVCVWTICCIVSSLLCFLFLHRLHFNSIVCFSFRYPLDAYTCTHTHTYSI